MPRTLPNERAYQRPIAADTASAAIIATMSSVDSDDFGTGELGPLPHATTSRAMPTGTHRSPCQKKKFAVTAWMRSSGAVSRGGIWRLRLVCSTNWYAMRTPSRGDPIRVPSPESRVPSPESRVPSPESRVPSPESRVPFLVPSAARQPRMVKRGNAMPPTRSGFPEWVEPMAATLTQERFTGAEWSFARTFDGIRLVAFKRGADVRLFSRTRNAQHLPAVASAIASLPVNDAILDGEMTWDSGHAAYHLFDVLWWDGDVRSLPLTARRELLAGLPLRDPLRLVEELDDAEPWNRARVEGWEGVIAKRRDSVYEHRRS